MEKYKIEMYRPKRKPHVVYTANTLKEALDYHKNHMGYSYLQDGLETTDIPCLIYASDEHLEYNWDGKRRPIGQIRKVQ